MDWWWAYLVIGLAVGFLAGLLGIGGGMVMVPMLVFVFTSLSSVRAHHRHGGVDWPVARAMAPGILAGSFAAELAASLIPTRPLAVFFSGFMFYAAAQMLISVRPKATRQLPGRTSLDATIRYRGKAKSFHWEAGYALRWRDWDEDLDNGYFDPTSFHANAGVGALEGRFWRVDAEAGLQSFTQGATRVSGDFYGTVRGTLFSQVRPWVRLEGYAGGGSYAAQGGADWTYRQIGAKARFTFGGE